MHAAVHTGPVNFPDRTSIRGRLRPEIGGVLLGCVCLAATNAFSLAIPWLVKSSIDALRAQPASVAHAIVVRDAALIIGFAIAQALIRTWSRILIFNAGRNVEYRLRRDLFSHLMRMEPAFYRRHPTGDLMSRLTNDLSAVRMLFGPGLLNLFNTAFVYATALWLLVRLSPALTLWALLPYPLVLLGRAAGVPPHVPGQPCDRRPAGDDVGRHSGRPGRDRGHQALRAGAGAPGRFPEVERRVSDALADVGSRARDADAAVRDAGGRLAR